MVFGARLAEHIEGGASGPEPGGALRAVLGETPIDGIGCTPLPPRVPLWAPLRGRGRADGLLTGPDVTKLRDVLQRAMTRGAGVVRSATSLEEARGCVAETVAALADAGISVASGELANLLQLADALLASAEARTESRGAHARAEYPLTEPAWRRRLVHGA